MNKWDALCLKMFYVVIILFLRLYDNSLVFCGLLTNLDYITWLPVKLDVLKWFLYQINEKLGGHKKKLPNNVQRPKSNKLQT